MLTEVFKEKLSILSNETYQITIVTYEIWNEIYFSLGIWGRSL